MIQTHTAKAIVAVIDELAVCQIIREPTAGTKHTIIEISAAHDFVAFFRPAEMRAVIEVFGIIAKVHIITIVEAE